MKIPSLPFAPGDFFRYPLQAQLVNEAETPTAEDIAELHAVVRTGTSAAVKHKIGNAANMYTGSNVTVLFMAIESTTGNTLMQTALLAQRMELIDILRHFRSHNGAAYQQPLYALWSHQSDNGDTILHSAVRTGKVEFVKASMQVFSQGHLDAADKTFQVNEEGEDDFWYDSLSEETDYIRIGELVFLLRCNKDGRTAAGLARALGYDEIVAWLEKCLAVDDPQRQRDDPSVVQLWIEGCDEYYGLP